MNSCDVRIGEVIRFGEYEFMSRWMSGGLYVLGWCKRIVWVIWNVERVLYWIYFFVFKVLMGYFFYNIIVWEIG